MKFLIASDIHGSIYYLRKVMDAFERERADRIILLGDLLNHGPRNDLPKDYDTKACFALYNEYKDRILCVRGNCDSEVDQMVLEFPCLADYALLPVGNRMVFITHGHIFNKGNLPPLQKGDILLHGHTHLSVCEDLGGPIYCNPGSVSMPKENHPHGYMTLENNILTWEDIEGEAYRTYTIE